LTTIWTVYILELVDRSLYTGITNNLERRIKLHNAGKGSKYVRSRLPLILKYKECLATKSEALKREAQIKKLSHKQKIQLIDGETNKWAISLIY
jgi:putative endonuclease